MTYYCTTIEYNDGSGRQAKKQILKTRYRTGLGSIEISGKCPDGHTDPYASGQTYTMKVFEETVHAFTGKHTIDFESGLEKMREYINRIVNILKHYGVGGTGTWIHGNDSIQLRYVGEHRYDWNISIQGLNLISIKAQSTSDIMASFKELQELIDIVPQARRRLMYWDCTNFC